MIKEKNEKKLVSAYVTEGHTRLQRTFGTKKTLDMYSYDIYSSVD